MNYNRLYTYMINFKSQTSTRLTTLISVLVLLVSVIWSQDAQAQFDMGDRHSSYPQYEGSAFYIQSNVAFNDFRKGPLFPIESWQTEMLADINNNLSYCDSSNKIYSRYRATSNLNQKNLIFSNSILLHVPYPQYYNLFYLTVIQL